MFYGMDLTIGGRQVKVGIHPSPHLDEAAAVWLLTSFPMEEADLDELLAHYPDSIIKLGFSGGPLDEHPQREQGSTVCAADLVLEWLPDSVRDDEAAMRLLDNVREVDAKGRAKDYRVTASAVIMKSMIRSGHFTDQQAVEHGAVSLQALYHSWQSYFEAGKEIEEKGKIQTIESYPNPQRPFRVLTIQSDNGEVPNYAFGELDIAVVIIQETAGELAGNTQILTNHAFRVDMDDVTKVIRRTEQFFHCGLRGHIPVTDWKELSQVGHFPDPGNPDHEELLGMPVWYYFRDARMLLNGSEAHPDVAPTKIPLVNITEIVVSCLDPDFFEKKRAKDCLEGHCTATADNPCSLYAWGLKRCGKMRYEQRNGNDRKEA